MSAELQRSQFARETLESSTRSLGQLGESYGNLDRLLRSSRSLVGTLITSQKSDTWYLESAFLVLSVTIGWLVFRRLLYGPGWWLLYLPLRLLLRTGLLFVQGIAGVLVAVSGAAGGGGQSSALGSLSSSFSRKVGGKAGIPTFPPGMPSPTVAVGGGGFGAKQTGPASSLVGGEGRLSDRVGEMAEGSRREVMEGGDGDGVGVVEEGGEGDGKGKEEGGETEEREKGKKEGGEGDKERGGGGQETALRERRDDEKPNPKKRMWEEPVADSRTPRDEL